MPRLEGTRVIGRGAADMKGGDAAILPCSRSARSTGAPVVCVFYDREEGPNRENGIHAVLARVAPARAARHSRSSASPRAATFMRAASASSTPISSSTGARRTARGRGRATARSCAPCRSWSARRARAQRPVVVEGLTFHDTLCITQIHGGVARNVVPDRVELALNVRFAPGREAAARARRGRGSWSRARAS